MYWEARLQRMGVYFVWFGLDTAWICSRPFEHLHDMTPMICPATKWRRFPISLHKIPKIFCATHAGPKVQGNTFFATFENLPLKGVKNNTQSGKFPRIFHHCMYSIYIYVQYIYVSKCILPINPFPNVMPFPKTPVHKEAPWGLAYVHICILYLRSNRRDKGGK